MKTMHKRLTALEAMESFPKFGRVDLDALSNAELDQMEAIAINIENGRSVESLCDNDLRFIATLPVLA